MPGPTPPAPLENSSINICEHRPGKRMAVSGDGRLKSIRLRYECPLWVISGHSSPHPFMSALPPKADILKSNPRCVWWPYPPRHLFPLRTRTADRLLYVGRERFLRWFLFVLPAVAYLRTIGVIRHTPGLTDPATPGVPSRTRGYYGPRA